MSEDRWTKVKEFIAEWFEPLGEGDGYSEEEIAEAEARLGIRLPEALREWYGFAGKRKELYKQNYIDSLENLSIWNGMLTVWSENQDVCRWGIIEADLSKENPPVYVEDDNCKNKWKVARNIEDFTFSFLVNEYDASAPFRCREYKIDVKISDMIRECCEKIKLPLSIEKTTAYINEDGGGAIFLNRDMEFYKWEKCICHIEEVNWFSLSGTFLSVSAKTEMDLLSCLSMIKIDDFCAGNASAAAH
jgi:hypothetical protein